MSVVLLLPLAGNGCRVVWLVRSLSLLLANLALLLFHISDTPTTKTTHAWCNTTVQYSTAAARRALIAHRPLLGLKSSAHAACPTPTTSSSLPVR